VINGVVNSIIGFKTGLEQLGHEVFVFCPTYREYKDDPNDKNIVHCKSWPLPGKSGYHYIYPLDNKVKEIAKTMDIIHVQHPFIMGKRAVNISKVFNKPLVFTNHTQYDQYAHYIPLPKAIAVNQIIKYLRTFSKNIDLIVAPAQGIKDKLLSYSIKTPIEIIPNGIDVDRFEKKVSVEEINKLYKKYHIDSSDTILMYTGRIAEEKNIGFLLEVLKHLIVKNNKIKLILVGGGLEKEHFDKTIAMMDLSDNAIITDYVDYSAIPQYLSIADIYVTASKTEVHPLTLLEAMARGLTSVIVKAPGTGDVIENNVDGLVSKDDVNDFAKNVMKLIDDKKLCDRLARTAIKKAQNYSYLTMSKKMEKIYFNLLNSKSQSLNSK
jgi:glycosyltransferase involved in cell wall biosynthesis